MSWKENEGALRLKKEKVEHSVSLIKNVRRSVLSRLSVIFGLHQCGSIRLLCLAHIHIEEEGFSLLSFGNLL